MALVINISQGDFGTYKVKLTGALDSSTYRELEEALKPPLEDPEAKAIRMELQDLKFISSMGIGTFVRTRKAIEGKGGVFAVVGAQPQIQKVFEIMRVLPNETVFASVAEADQYLMAIQKRVMEDGSGNYE